MSYCLNLTCAKPQNLDGADCDHCGSPLRLHHYLALSPIAQGGFGRTFLAVNEAELLKPRCVIKQFFPQQQDPNLLKTASQLFQQEAKRLKQLGHHAQIPTLLAYLERDNHQYLVQEWIDGETLEQELESGAFTEDQIHQLLQDLLPVLQFIHDHHVIHRDIKPANIIRRYDDRTLVLVDLGAAKFATGTALLKTGTMIGSAEYTAPEQIRGKALFSSDLYSLGVTCVHLLTQMSPFDLFDGTEGRWIWRDYVTTPVSNALATVLDKLLESATNRRYRSAESVLADLSPPKMTPRYRVENLEVPPIVLNDQPARISSISTSKMAKRSASHHPSRVSNWSFPAALIVLSLPVFMMSVSRSLAPPSRPLKHFVKPTVQRATIAVPRSPVQVSISTIDHAQILITVDGTQVFQGTLSKGTRRTWKANQQIILQAENAGSLMVSSNQKPDRVFGKSGEIKEAIFSN